MLNPKGWNIIEIGGKPFFLMVVETQGLSFCQKRICFWLVVEPTNPFEKDATVKMGENLPLFSGWT